ncbi:hypothetical protein LINPERHAP1_LOCUS16174 [Linum perenne]
MEKQKRSLVCRLTVQVASTVEKLDTLRLNVLGEKEKRPSKLLGMVMIVMKKHLILKKFGHTWPQPLMSKSLSSLNISSRCVTS